MSSYYVSKCCNAEALYVTDSGAKEAKGQCTKCGEMAELVAVIDNE